MEYTRAKDSITLERAGNFIKSVGFPIVAFLMMFYFSFVTLQENTRTLVKISETLNLLAIRIK